MSKKTLGVIILVVFSFIAMAQVPAEIQKKKDKDEKANIIAGRNVNMVAGQELFTGDPYLQRQNEPSLAVSTRNPMHLLAGANDYRTVDFPETEGELPGKQNEAIAAGDAWLGVFKSFDGGQSWISTMLPGYPQDVSGEEVGFSLKPYQVAADPVVRAGANGLFFYNGIAFQRGEGGLSTVFVARYIDNNNKEGGDTIEYVDTTMIDLGDGLNFIDKPWIAVDVPRTDDLVTLPNGQEVSRFNVYIVYSVFTGDKSEIRYSKSEDSGQSWSDPEPLAEAEGQGYFNIAKKKEEGVFQGATLAFSPKDGRVYVAWRKFDTDSKKSEGAIYFTRTDKKGKKFEKIEEVEKKIEPFDQGSSTATFRTNSYPTMAVDEDGTVYLAWAEREKGKNGQAQIVITSSKDGKKWEKPKEVEKNKDSGHQFMPSLTYAGGKLMLAWYDQREDISGRFTEYIDDISGQTRHTIDVRAAYAKPEKKPDFEDSIQVSRYLFVYDESSDTYFQAQFNPPNYPLFKGGMWPFHGDYLDIAPSPMFIQDESGDWHFNTEETDTSVFHVAWTDNRDVSPPADGVWINYSPPGAGCFGNASPGMRNQNIYTSRISYGIEVGSPGNAKPMQIDRAFVINVKNTTEETKNFRLFVADQTQASFLEHNDLFELDVTIAPFSSISRPVFVNPTVGQDSIRIDIFEIDVPGGSEIPGGLSSFVILNQDNTNPDLEDPDVGPGGVGNKEIHNPNIANPNIANWTVLNPNIANPNIANPNIANPNIANPNIANPNIANPNIANPNIANPNIANPNIANPNIANPNIANASLDGSQITDVEWTVTNEGNTTSSYTFKSFANQAPPEGLFLQLLIYKVHYTPGTDFFATDSCALKKVPHHELLANITNPNIANPNIANPNIANPNIANPNIANASFSVAPGEEVIVNLRLIDPPDASGMASISARTMAVENFVDSLGGGVTSHSANSGDEIPPAAASKLIIGTSSLPPGVVGELYPDPNPPEYAVLKAFGGTGTLNWSVIGSLPPGLSLINSDWDGDGIIDGVITGTPADTSLGLTYPFTVQVTDSDTPQQSDTQLFSITVSAPSAPLSITSASPLPSAFEGQLYGTLLEASGGSWPYTWSLAAGALPPGLRIDGEWLTGTAGAEGEYHFDLRVTDDSGTSVTKAFMLEILPPGAQNQEPGFIENDPQFVTMDEDGSPTAFSLTLNAGDGDGDPISWSISTPASNGTASVSGIGPSKAISYTPNPNWNGSDSFGVGISDGKGGTDNLTVNVTVNPRNDPPNNTALPSILGTPSVGQTLTANIGTWDDSTDQIPGAITHTYQWERADDASGTNLTTITGATASAYVLTAADINKFLRVQVTGTDNGEGLPATQSLQVATAYVQVVNQAPMFTESDPQPVTMDEDSSPTDFSLTLNATDGENDPITWSISTPASNGTASVSGIGPSKAISYTPNPNWNGSDSFGVGISDGNGGTDNLTVNVTIQPRNDPPNNTVPPSIVGTPIVGQTLTANPGTWDDSTDLTPGTVAPTYQWQRADDAGGSGLTDISGATASTYVLTAADLNKFVRVQVTGTDNGEGQPPAQSTVAVSTYVLVTIPTYSISGTVYYSTGGLSGVTVKLINGAEDPGTGIPLDTDTTDGSGAYSFTSVSDGSYWVRIDAPPESLFIDWTASSVTIAGDNVVKDMDLPQKLILSTPTSGSTIHDTTPELTWVSNSEATNYDIQLNETSSWDLIETGDSTTNNYTVVTSLDIGMDYSWQVDAYDAVGHHVGTSESAFTFDIDYPLWMTLLTPPSGSTVNTLNPTLTWDEIPQATYTVYVYSGETMVETQANILTTSYTVVTPLVGGQSYSWEVDAHLGSQHVGTTETPFTFTTAISADGIQTTDLTVLTPGDLVSELLGTPTNFSVSNILYTGSATAAGEFSGGTGIVGFESGIILSSGRIDSIPGPNSSDSTGTGFGLAGDSELDSLVSPLLTEDAAILEFDFTPNVDGELTLRYLFTSEEYNEYANTDYNDVLGIFIDGVNEAKLPDGITLVSVNSVNGGNPLGTNAVNPQWFINNDPSDGTPQINIEGDGLTFIFEVKYSYVDIGLSDPVPHHIKLAIADVDDAVYDTWVFVEGSFVPATESPTTSQSIMQGEKTGIFLETDNHIEKERLMFAEIPDKIVNIIKLTESRKQK